MKKIKLQENGHFVDVLRMRGGKEYYGYRADQEIYNAVGRDIIANVYGKTATELTGVIYNPVFSHLYISLSKNAN